jgi:hypothetical protein
VREDILAMRTLIEKKMEIDLSTAPIEVQIVSSCDAASHYIGPFMTIDWRENSQLAIDELFDRGAKKMKKDFERRVTLPEVREFLEKRRGVYEEQYQ